MKILFFFFQWLLKKTNYQKRNQYQEAVWWSIIVKKRYAFLTFWCFFLVKILTLKMLAFWINWQLTTVLFQQAYHGYPQKHPRSLKHSWKLTMNQRLAILCGSVIWRYWINPSQAYGWWPCMPCVNQDKQYYSKYVILNNVNWFRPPYK